MDTNFLPSRWRDELTDILSRSGVVRFGIARAEKVDEAVIHSFRQWIDQGCNAGMEWLGNHADIRENPALLLPDACSLIVCAFPYSKPVDHPSSNLRFASYALGEDYHNVIRKRLKVAVHYLAEGYGAKSRICVDSAPLFERFWAVRAGLGYIARNCQLVIPGLGSRFFIGTIVTTLPLPPDKPLNETACLECGRCVKACPGQALAPQGIPQLDARRCLSYLTIEHKGELPPWVKLGNNIYGCDICLSVCPLNDAENPPLPEFQPDRRLLTLTENQLLQMDEESWISLSKNSPIRRAGLQSILRNIRHR